MSDTSCKDRLKRAARQIADLTIELQAVHLKLDRAGVPRLSKIQDASDRVYHALLAPDSLFVPRGNPEPSGSGRAAP